MTKLTPIPSILLLAAALQAGACAGGSAWRQEPAGPEKLIVHPDGSIEFRNRLMADEDVIIYDDGFGGERAAVRVRMEPLHPDFFRDTIAVERRQLGDCASGESYSCKDAGALD